MGDPKYAGEMNLGCENTFFLALFSPYVGGGGVDILVQEWGLGVNI